MGDAGGQDPDAGHLLGLDQVHLLQPLLRDVSHEHQGPRVVADGVLDRGGGDVQVERLLPLPHGEERGFHPLAGQGTLNRTGPRFLQIGVEDVLASFPGMDLSGEQRRADLVVVLHPPVVVVDGDAVADGIEDRLQLVGLVAQLDLRLLALTDVLGGPVDLHHLPRAVQQRLDDGVDPLAASVGELEAVLDLVALRLLDAKPQLPEHLVPVLRVHRRREALLVGRFAREPQDAQELVRGLDAAGHRVEAPGADVGHRLRLGEVVLALGQRPLGELLFRDVDQDGEALIARFGDHRLDPDVERQPVALRQPQAAGHLPLVLEDAGDVVHEDEAVLSHHERFEALPRQVGAIQPQKARAGQVDLADHTVPVEGEVPHGGEVVEEGVLVPGGLQLGLEPAQLLYLRLQGVPVALFCRCLFQGMVTSSCPVGAHSLRRRLTSGCAPKGRRRVRLPPSPRGCSNPGSQAARFPPLFPAASSSPAGGPGPRTCRAAGPPPPGSGPRPSSPPRPCRSRRRRCR